MVDAITCFRPYRQALGLDAALAELESQRGIQFDATVVDALLKALSQDNRMSDFTNFINREPPPISQ